MRSVGFAVRTFASAEECLNWEGLRDTDCLILDVRMPGMDGMNSVGLNIFIAIVGISAGPGFINGLKTQGVGLFLWGALATTIPLVLGMFIAKYLFRFHDALTLGIVSGARTTTASLGLVCDIAKSQVPALGYTVTYAVGNTLLTIWGMSTPKLPMASLLITTATMSAPI